MHASGKCIFDVDPLSTEDGEFVLIDAIADADKNRIAENPYNQVVVIDEEVSNGNPNNQAAIMMTPNGTIYIIRKEVESDVDVEVKLVKLDEKNDAVMNRDNDEDVNVDVDVDVEFKTLKETTDGVPKNLSVLNFLVKSN